MIRKLAGYSVLAVLGVLALKLLLWVIGVAFSLLMTVFWIAAIGFVIYLVLRVISPQTADVIRDTIRGVVRNDVEVEEAEEVEEVEAEVEEEEDKAD
jgi:hypothetical protein